MKICQDMDGVIFDLMSEYIRIYNEQNSDSKTIDDVTHWDFYEDWGMTNEECFAIFDIIDQRNCKLLDPGIPYYLRTMNEHHDVDIVTLKPIQNGPIIKEALEMNGIFEGTHYNELKVLSYEVSDIKSKLDYDIYIDDSPKLAKTIRDMGNKILLLYDSPWNRSVRLSSMIERVNSWETIMNILSSYSDV